MSSILQLFKRLLQAISSLFQTYPISLSICLIGFLAHFSFIFLFDYWAVPLLSSFNVVSSLLWAWAVVEVARGHVNRSVYIGTVEVLLHAQLSMSVLGLDSGFDLYLWPLAGWLAYNPYIERRFALIVGSISIFVWIWGRGHWGQNVDLPISVDMLEMMFRVNAVIAGGVFIVGILGARIYVDQQSEKLTAQADRDDLTGLYNRRYVTDYIHIFEHGEQTDRRSYALIMTDIDHFKTVNDKYGHDTGDDVLKAFSSLLQGYFRKEDMVARWGGEEFIVLLPKCTLAEATAKAEAIRNAIANQSVARALGQSVYVTASFGVTKSFDGERFTDIFSRADKLLYQAKDSGRNRVVSG